MLVPFTSLSPSRRERGVRQVACLLALAGAVVLLAGAWRSDPLDPLLVLAALAIGAGACVAGRMPGRAPLEVGVDSAGQLVARAVAAAGAPVQPLQCVFATPWLITARGGTMWVSIWPDSIPGNAFRRCWVHIQWSRVRAVDSPAGSAPSESK